MRTTHLPQRTVVSVKGPAAGVAIGCDSGMAWITQCCDSMDYVLTPGMDFATQKNGKIIVQVFRNGKISIGLRRPSSDGLPPGGPAQTLRSWHETMSRWGRRLLAAFG